MSAESLTAGGLLLPGGLVFGGKDILGDYFNFTHHQPSFTETFTTDIDSIPRNLCTHGLNSARDPNWSQRLFLVRPNVEAQTL